MYGKVIISERYLPVNEKTIKPNDALGGVAGGIISTYANLCYIFILNVYFVSPFLPSSSPGEKYIHQGILFKFAVDVLVYPSQKPTPTPSHSHSPTTPSKEGGGGEEMWMYGGEQPSDEAAQHVAANELRGLFLIFVLLVLLFISLKILLLGLISVFKCDIKHLHVPIMALIDYLGFR